MGDDDLEAYLPLAREIRREVARIAADPDLAADELRAFIDQLPATERAKVARSVFERLAPADQWAVLERVFGDEEIAGYLRAERDLKAALAAADQRHRRLRDAARLEHRLDLTLLPAGDSITLGLFRERDVRAAVVRGSRSTTCARRVVARSVGRGTVAVVEDVFNPTGGFFVTADYDEETWRDDDRLAANAIVRIGSSVGGSFEPVLFPGARVDVEVNGEVRLGRLHLGFATLAGADVFAE